LPAPPAVRATYIDRYQRRKRPPAGLTCVACRTKVV